MRTKVTVIVTTGIGCLAMTLLLPILLFAASSSANACRGRGGPSVDRIAATIRQLESGGNYAARSPGSTASGAYQFLDSSWHNYGGYPRAYLAPPEIQDAKAAANITAILDANGNDPAAVPVAWYLGHVPPPSSSSWDTVPAPEAGNRLTPREYQAKWMGVFEATAGGPTCAAGGLLVSGAYALPVDRVWYDQHPEWFTKPHHDYPAADIPVPTGTSIYAMTSGVVVSVTTGGRCGIGLVINGDDGAQYTYCHGLPGSHEVGVGDQVATGQQLMLSASTGNSTAPHLHVGISVRGERICPQALFVAIATGADGKPGQMPLSHCTS